MTDSETVTLVDRGRWFAALSGPFDPVALIEAVGDGSPAAAAEIAVDLASVCDTSDPVGWLMRGSVRRAALDSLTASGALESAISWRRGTPTMQRPRTCWPPWREPGHTPPARSRRPSSRRGNGSPSAAWRSRSTAPEHTLRPATRETPCIRRWGARRPASGRSRCSAAAFSVANPSSNAPKSGSPIRSPGALLPLCSSTAFPASASRPSSTRSLNAPPRPIRHGSSCDSTSTAAASTFRIGWELRWRSPGRSHGNWARMPRLSDPLA